MKKSYIIMGDPLPLARMKSGSRTAFWNEVATQKFAWQIQVDEQHSDTPLFTRPFYLEAFFYFAPPVKQLNKDKLMGKCYDNKPSIEDLMRGLLGILEGRIYKPSCMIVSLSAQKKYDKVPRTEWVCMEVE